MGWGAVTFDDIYTQSTLITPIHTMFTSQQNACLLDSALIGQMISRLHRRVSFMCDLFEKQLNMSRQQWRLRSWCLIHFSWLSVKSCNPLQDPSAHIYVSPCRWPPQCLSDLLHLYISSWNPRTQVCSPSLLQPVNLWWQELSQQRSSLPHLWTLQKVPEPTCSHRPSTH